MGPKQEPLALAKATGNFERGSLLELAKLSRRKGLENAISVTTRYKDLPGRPTKASGPSTRSSSRAAGSRTPRA